MTLGLLSAILLLLVAVIIVIGFTPKWKSGKGTYKSVTDPSSVPFAADADQSSCGDHKSYPEYSSSCAEGGQ